MAAVTTLNEIRKCLKYPDAADKRMLRKLKNGRSGDEPLPIVTIVENHGVENALRCMKAVKGYDKILRQFPVACARDVQHMMTSDQSINALNVADLYAKGEKTDRELGDAEQAAWAVWISALDAGDDIAATRAAEAAMRACSSDAVYAAIDTFRAAGSARVRAAETSCWTKEGAVAREKYASMLCALLA